MFDDRYREFLLPYSTILTATDPDAAVLQFLQSTYEAGADLGGWDRRALEPAELPGRPPAAAVEPRLVIGDKRSSSVSRADSARG